MSKRRINKQQAARIQKIQTNYRISDNNLQGQVEGLVLARYSRHAEIETVSGEKIHCSIRPNIDSLVAGDRVIWQLENNKQGVVLSRYPRHTVLGRPDKRGNQRPVAANISQLLVVIAFKPELSWPLLDSYLVMAENLQLKASIVLNKVDLPCELIKKELIDIYQNLGYPLVFTSREHHLGYNHLQDILKDEISVFVGQSGVGKSSLIAQVLPHESNIQVAALSEASELGCHTTSNSRYYHLPSGGALIDSPGVREFSLWKMSPADIVYGFKEFRSFVTQCKYRNCDHITSPGCAIIKNVNENNVLAKRYASLLKLI